MDGICGTSLKDGAFRLLGLLWRPWADDGSKRTVSFTVPLKIVSKVL